ncbi:MAG: Calx-beta domain-containing protein [Pyrinomonadaceae bacterium]
MLHSRLINHRPLVLTIIIAIISCALGAAGARASTPPVELLSVNSTGTGSGNALSTLSQTSFHPNGSRSSISADGRYVVFTSSATNLVSNDNNNKSDVFLRDRISGTTSLVSINNTGTGSANGNSSNPIISANGRFVVFRSTAPDVVTSGPAPTSTGLVVRDLVAGTTILVDVNTAGTGNGNSSANNHVVSDDGRYIAFESSASNLVTLPDTQDLDVFVRDIVAGTTIVASVNSTATATATGNCFNTAISADGRYVTFDTSATNVVANDTNNSSDVFVRDIFAATPELVSINNAGTASGNSGSANAVISSNGRYVAFQSQASDLVTNDIDTTPDVFVRDLLNDTTTIVSLNSAGTSGGNGSSLNPSISGDGRFIAFDSLAANLVSNDHNNLTDIFVRDTVANTTELVSANSDGVSAMDGTGSDNFFGIRNPVISDDGRYVLFVSQAADLLPGFTNGSVYNVFARDLAADVTTLVSVNNLSTSQGNNDSGSPQSDFNPVFRPDAPQISDDGTVIVWGSMASNLVSNDTNGALTDVFAAPLLSGTPHFSASAYTVNEQDGTATLTVNRTGGTTGTITVDYATSNDTAIASQDYTTSSGTLTFADGETTKTFNVPITNDLVTEPDETFNVKLSAHFNALPSAPSLAVITIISDDAVPQLTISNAQVTEGNSGIANMLFNVKLSNPSSETVMVDYATSDGTAKANVDYTPTNGTLSFSPGQLTKTVTVQVFSDTIDEANLTFNVNLTNPVNAIITDAQGVGTIVDNDPSPSLRINDVTVTEANAGAKNVAFTVLSSAVSGQAITVHYATANGTATAGSDYTSSAGTITIPAGSTSKTIIISVKGDTLDEPNETFKVNLTSPTHATIFDGQGIGTITDNDPTPGLRINNVTLIEGNSGTTNATFTVTLSAASGQTVKINYATANGTASAPSDYLTKTGTLTFAPGETTKTITVAVKGDTAHEPNETFFVNLSTAVNANITDGQGQGVITNND